MIVIASAAPMIVDLMAGRILAEMEISTAWFENHFQTPQTQTCIH
jgi:hypothetical protein